MRKINNKKGQAIAIGLLTFFTLMIITTSLFYILIKEGNVNEKISNAGLVDRTYSNADSLNFYLQDIASNSAKSIKDEKEFIENFKFITEEYKVQGGFYLDKDLKGKYPFLVDKNVLVIDNIASELSEENIEIISVEGKHIVNATFDIVIDESFYDYENKEESFNLKYSYTKSFKGLVD